jgi:hypothetical protein
MVHSSHPSYAGSLNRRLKVQFSPGIKVRPYQKNKAKKKKKKR